MKLTHWLLLTASALLMLGANAQGDGTAEQRDAKQVRAERQDALRKMKEANRVEKDGVEVRIKDIARFRGVRKNQITGFGLIVGLEGTGDSKKTPFTASLLANALKDFGTTVDAAQFQAKNIAAVTITAELPPYATPGNTIDVTVQSIGDAKSLQGGFLLQAPLYGQSDKAKAVAVAQGAVSIGGFNASSGGASVQKNHVNVGRIPDGAIVQLAVPYQVVFGDKLFLELDKGDITTSKRIAMVLMDRFPSYNAIAVDGGTIQVTVPSDSTAMEVMSNIELLTVLSDVEAVVIINERTGTIVLGGNVRLGPAVVAQGGLQVIIDSYLMISQPEPFSQGQTVKDEQKFVSVTEDEAKVALVGPSATIADLARIFQALKVTPRDMIAILQALKQQGALKARIEVQ
ncbi:MAG TPA: flagellar basal body P-ring protein FlgI [Fimbriimonadaceae bacterium]|nr:flagellar basal body P-ring protein FlgI [Fimbriimonadaceae bacterium]